MTSKKLNDRIIFLIFSVLLFLLSHILGVNFIIPVLLLIVAIFLKHTESGLNHFNLLNLSLLFTIIVSLSYFFISELKLPKFSIPFIILPMLITLLFNSLQLSLMITAVASLTIATIAGDNLTMAVLFFISGLLASILVLNARRRMTVIRSGFIVGIVQTVLFLLIDSPLPLFRKFDLTPYAAFFINGIVSSIIVLGVLPIFEALFKTMTNISLLELADFNHPLLLKLSLEAPGTFHHCLITGNLSEAACNAINANALLARIGAYYHDIGKLNMPQYFSENQGFEEESKHDTLAPSMSKLVIINHTKEGAELARKYKLNERIVDFIEQHHGKSLVYYFYRKALENLEEDEAIKEEGFRYPGPKPNTKEAAVVLLADSVEAATRALREHTPSKITEVVHKIINNKFIDGQLDECDLTLKDIEKISEVFIRL
ncbi:MAG: HDIG domain-containing protein, partial [Candidatus Omnitrophica bacterium]|nr:HDIG domain-containing protein [Candidatus Omnitrophota bacterium]